MRKPGCGLPIGNLTSQLFSNIYLNRLDHFVTEDLGFRYYGRYVDDFYLFDADKDSLLHAIRQNREFLADDLFLTLHPRKFSLQPVTLGTRFLGAVLKPGRRFPSPRTMKKWHTAQEYALPSVLDPYRTDAVLQSYRGYFSHFDVKCKWFIFR